ncbi:MAG: PIN domain-containing protein [Pirellulales bacterium]
MPSVFRTSELTLSEVLVHPLRLGNADLASIYMKMLAGAYWLSVVPVSPPVLEAASVLRASQRSLKLPDAVHVATAMFSGCSHFLTQDQRITDFEPLKHPFREQALPALKIVRLDMITLSSILEAIQ